MVKKSVHHIDFESLLEVNKQVVLLTKEPHEYSDADGEKLKELLTEVQERANDEEHEEAISNKASYLVFKVASGQHFRAGNKRTALVAGLVFLRKNGHKLDMSDPSFVSVVDRAGVAAASLDDLHGVLMRLEKKSPAERKGWQSAIKETVNKNRKFLTEQGS